MELRQVQSVSVSIVWWHFVQFQYMVGLGAVIEAGKDPAVQAGHDTRWDLEGSRLTDLRLDLIGHLDESAKLI